MEPEPLTPGTSHEPPTSTNVPNCALASLTSPDSPGDDLMSAKWAGAGEEQSGAEPGRGAQRTLKSSAFTSSLSWDSDSEKEALDEELQNFSNPHGLAAHSPGSPSSGLRLDSKEEREAEKLQRLSSKTDPSPPVDRRSDIRQSADASPLGQKELEDGGAWDASERGEAFLSRPKDGSRMEAEEDSSEKEARPKRNQVPQPERDVYTFPGDSDPESPPPAPWAHCTFIQRCRKKRVLLRPFSGLRSLNKSESGKLTKRSPLRCKAAKSGPVHPGGGVYDFEEGFEEGPAETRKLRGRGGKKPKEAEEEAPEIFTCVECSIYFRKQVHLKEHMAQHSQSTAGGGRRAGKGRSFQCAECGWNLPNRPALADHHRRHCESRLKILEEIEKLNENGNEAAENEENPAHPAVAQHTGPVYNAGKMSAPEIVKSPPLSPASLSTPDQDFYATPLTSAGIPAQTRTVSSYRRRFVCTKCNFSTRTSQALANHSKTHNRKKPALQADSPSPGSASTLASTSLRCGHCAFLTSSLSTLREHQTLVHHVSARGKHDDGGSHLSESGSFPEAAQGKSQHGITAPEDEAAPDGAAAQPKSQAVGSRRLSTRGKTWTEFNPEMDDESSSRREKLDRERRKEPTSEENSPVGGKPRTKAKPNTEESSSVVHATLSLPTKTAAEDEDKKEMDKDGKVFFLRRSRRVTAASAPTDSDDDDVDEVDVQHFLSHHILDEDDSDEDPEALKPVEKKCPYCPDRFHNGIGLANHVRGHLNRVGVSYNVRHFISPEEVNAIEKKFSYQKKKKKVANFDPDTFSVMHCEFCKAGFDTRAGLSSHARAHLRDFGITNWDITISPIHILRELFSSRPDLVIPTAPPRSQSSYSEEEEEEEEEEGEEDDEERNYKDGIIKVKLEGGTSKRTPCVSDLNAVASASCHQWKKKDGEEDCRGVDGAEEDDEDLQRSAPDGVSDGPGNAVGGSQSTVEDADTKAQHLKCEVCDSRFESGRGLSSHAHLRQLGVTASERRGGTPTDLCRIAKECHTDGKVSLSLSDPLPATTPSPPAPVKDEDLEDMDLDEKPIPAFLLAKAAKAVSLPSSSPAPTPSPGASPASSVSGSPSVVKKAPISSLLPVSSPLRSPELKAGGMKSLSATPSAETAKPLWAPQENDAPLNLALEMDSSKDIVCQLCGAWFETRKGLSSHARAHLRHFGVEYSESKGSPIDLLSQLIDTDDFKHKAGTLELDSLAEPKGLNSTVSSAKQSLLTLSSSPSLLYKVTAAGGGSTSKATSPLLGPPAKRPKASSMQVFRLSSGELMALPHSEPPKEIGCEFCGEYFENRKGLSSHARSHLRQMGITEWTVNGSPIDTLREIITRRGLPCALPQNHLKTPPSSSPGPPRSPLTASSSPSAGLLSRLPFTFARPSSPPQPSGAKSSSASSAPPGGLSLKLKSEPVQLEVTAPAAAERSGGFSGGAPNSNWSSDNAFPLNLAKSPDVEPTRDIRCEFCGEYFENRKGLSSHARSHLRQMGITEWCVNGSPIDTLREVMNKKGLGASSDQGVKKELSHRASSPSWEKKVGRSESFGFYQSSKYRNSPLSLVQSGPRVQKPGLGSGSGTTSAARFFRMSPLGKRPLSGESRSGEAPHSSPHRLKTTPPLPRDFSVKRKPSPEKHQDPSCELCGFYFENRKALASHARAHLRQFGVTEWSVNGSPIETLSAWMRSRPQKVLEMHRSYMQGNRSALKKKAPSSSSSSPSSSSSQWSSSVAVSLGRPASQEVGHRSSSSSSRASGDHAGTSSQGGPVRPGRGSPGFSRPSSASPPQAPVARSELNVRLPRGFERRPLKHPSCPEGAERDSGTPKPLRTGTVPALVPKPPSYPLVKLVGKFYTLKCRFCEVEFHGPLSVQEDWIRHLQQHIIKMNYNKPAACKATAADPQPSVQASTSTSRTSPAAVARSCSPATLSDCAPAITATEGIRGSEEQPGLIPAPLPLPTQTA
ncbi:protein Wiz isoform X2 [Oryzias latipes]|uniref:protein Wiz isoform X2 n=1 Tax=Oryzias latipes TaxID=8090 RepID=UPI000CE1E41D|nr:protein Wiz isoform X2 [Oryzias latipes]